MRIIDTGYSAKDILDGTRAEIFKKLISIFADSDVDDNVIKSKLSYNEVLDIVELHEITTDDCPEYDYRKELYLKLKREFENE